MVPVPLYSQNKAESDCFRLVNCHSCTQGPQSWGSLSFPPLCPIWRRPFLLTFAMTGHSGHCPREPRLWHLGVTLLPRCRLFPHLPHPPPLHQDTLPFSLAYWFLEKGSFFLSCPRGTPHRPTDYHLDHCLCALSLETLSLILCRRTPPNPHTSVTRSPLLGPPFLLCLILELF